MEYSTSHLYFLGIHTRLRACVYTNKIQVTSGIFHGLSREKCFITILYHAIENTVGSTINATYAQTLF